MAKQNQRQEVRQQARQAAQSGNFGQSNVQAMRDAGVRPQVIQNIREQARQAPTSSGSGMNIGYGVTNTGTPGNLSMPGGTDASGRPIPASQASNIFKLNIPFSTAGVTNIMGNPMNNFDTGFQVVGDGVNWQDPANAGLLSQYTSPDAINRHINSMWAMSSANPNRDANMAAFIDSGHAESLITGKPPSAMPANYSGLFNPAMTGLNTPWSQQYAAANGGYGGAGGTSAQGTSQGTGSAQTSAATPSKAKNIQQAIKIAAATGRGNNLVTNKEFGSIYDKYGKGMDAMKVASIFDKVNARGQERGMAGIGMTGNLMNKLYSGKYGGSSPYSNMFGAGGDGDFSRILRGMGDTMAYGGAGDGASYTNVPGTGKFKNKSNVYGYLNNSSQILTDAGRGKPYSKTKWGTGLAPVTAGVTDGSVGTGSTGSGDVGTGDMGNPMTPEQMKDASTTPVDSMVNGAGSALSSFATGFRSPQRGRQKAGRKASGYGSMTIRNAPGYASGVGLN